MSGIVLSNTEEQQQIIAKRAELRELEARIAQLEPEMTNTKSALKVFEKRYLELIGLRYDELADIEREIATLQGLTLDEVEAEVEASDSLSDDAVGCGQNRLHADKLKKLYREVARKFHPDLAEDDTTRMHCTQLMIEANRAYEAGASEALQAILEASEAEAQLAVGSPELVWLTKRVADLRAQAARLEAELQSLQESELHRLRLRVEKADAIGVDLLADLVAQVDRQIRKARNRLEALQGVMMTA